MRSKILIELILCFAASFMFAQPTDGIIMTKLFQSDSSSQVSCYRIPALITATNGDLIAAIDERVPSCNDLRGNENINIVIRRSTNNGRTWSEIERIIDYPNGQSSSDPSMVVDQKTGTIFMFYNFMDLQQEKDVYYLKVIQSDDHGLTWSKPLDITNQITPQAWHNDFKFITSGRGYYTSDERLVHTLVNLEKGLFVFESLDHGKSWQLISTPISPGDESKFIELPEGKWMVNSRVNGAGFRYVHTSNDKGKSWTTRQDTVLVDPGCNASLIRNPNPGQKSDGKLLFLNVSHPNKRENLTIKYSEDHGQTWSLGKVIYPGKAAYSTMTALSNGEIGVLFEKDDYSEISFVILTSAWFEK